MAESIISIFEKYGWGGLIGIVICGILILGIKFLMDKFTKDVSTGLERVGEKLSDQISKQNDNLMTTLVTQQDKMLEHILNHNNYKTETHYDMLNDKIKLAEEINASLKEIMLTHQACRACIIEFHNSNNNLSGIPFAKYSCTYEWFDKGVISVMNICNNMSFSQLAKVTNDVLKSENDVVVYNDMNKFKEDNPSLWSAVGKEENETTSIVYSALYDKNNILIGLLILEYQHDVHKFTKEEINQLQVQSAELTSIINLRYKYQDYQDKRI